VNVCAPDCVLVVDFSEEEICVSESYVAEGAT
jgi:hypothetical protein